MQMLNIPFSTENGNTYQIKATNGKIHKFFKYPYIFTKKNFIRFTFIANKYFHFLNTSKTPDND